MSDYSRELVIARRAARLAGTYLRESQQHTRIQTQKVEGQIHNFALEQDIQADRIIEQTIQAAFPGDFILSEETLRDPVAHNRMWIVDPLDGTRNYANGFPIYAVCIALWEGNSPVVGVVYLPGCNDELFHAVRGQGAFVSDLPLKVRDPDKSLAQSLVATGFSYDRGEKLQRPLRRYAGVLEACTDLLRTAAAAVDICYVAAGRFGAYYESGLKPWDIAAASLILTETGGLCTDFTAQPVDFFQQTDQGYGIDLIAAKNEEILKEMVPLVHIE